MRHFFVGVVTLLLLTAATRAFDIPKLDNIAIDGDRADWGERGLVLGVLSAIGDRPAPGDLDARARVAWDETRLLVLISVKDDVADESPTMETLWTRDSIELFVADKVGGKVAAQVIVSPGMAKDQTKLRVNQNDRRNGAVAEPLAFESAVTKTDGGYDVEIAVPWKSLGLTAAMGMESALQFYVNDTDADGKPKSKLVWFPKDDTSAASASMNAIKLAAIPSEPVNFLAQVTHKDFRRLLVSAVARGEMKDAQMLVRSVVAGNESNRELGVANATTAGDLAYATLALPMPALGEKSSQPKLEVSMAGKNEVIPLPDLDKPRLAAFDRLDIKPRTWVFTGDTFPAIDFDNIDRAENLVGEYTITTRYFDAAMKEVARPATFGRFGAVVTIQVPNQPARTKYLTLCRLKDALEADEWRTNVELPLADLLKLQDVITPREAEDISDYTKSAFLDATRESQWLAVLIAGLLESSGEAEKRSVGDRNEQWWFDLRAKLGQPLKYKYLDFVPKTAEEKKPAILFLHGSGERGDDLSRLENNGPRAYAKRTSDFPFIVISPQCPAGEWWNPLAVNALAEELLAKYPIDPERFYLTGLSMGGYGTWGVGPRFPTRFAAFVPICGGGDELDVPAMADVPTWVFHGGRDTVVRPKQSYRLVEALRKANGRVRYTLYPAAGHDSWTATYNDPRLYEWFLQQRRGAPAEPKFEGEPTTQPTEIR